MSLNTELKNVSAISKLNENELGVGSFCILPYLEMLIFLLVITLDIQQFVFSLYVSSLSTLACRTPCQSALSNLDFAVSVEFK